MGAGKLIMKNMYEMGLLYDELAEFRDYNRSYGLNGDFLNYTEYQLAEELLPDPYMGESLFGEKLLLGDSSINLERVALYWYFRSNEGDIFDGDDSDTYIAMTEPSDLIIITEDWKKRAGVWQKAMVPFLLFEDRNSNQYDIRVVVDSWENIAMYAFERGCFFIFDEYVNALSGNNCEEAADAFFTMVDHGQLNTWIMTLSGTGRCDVVPAFSYPSELY